MGRLIFHRFLKEVMFIFPECLCNAQIHSTNLAKVLYLTLILCPSNPFWREVSKYPMNSVSICPYTDCCFWSEKIVAVVFGSQLFLTLLL